MRPTVCNDAPTKPTAHPSSAKVFGWVGDQNTVSHIPQQRQPEICNARFFTLGVAFQNFSALRAGADLGTKNCLHMAAASGLADENTRQEVKRLRDEFVQLNAERMQYMQAFERTKRTNEGVIVQLRDENRQLKQQVAELQSDTFSAEGSGLTESEQERLTGEVTLWRSKQDGLSHSVKQLSAQYSKLREEFMALHRQRSTAIDTPEMRTVRSLENRLDKAMLK